MDDDHIVVKTIKQYSADPDSLTEKQIAANFAVLDDLTRTEVLAKTRAWLTDDDSHNLRQKSQLLNLTRKMGDVHTNLRRVGR